MKHFTLLNLRLFDGAPAAPAAGGEGSDTGGAQTLPLNTRKGAKTGEKVVFGNPPEGSEGGESGSDAGNNAQGNPASSPEEKRKAFESLINGEYKDMFTQRTQDIISRRFKEVKTLEETSAKQQAAIEPLLQKYGVNDLDALTKAIDEDNDFWEQAASAANMDVPTFKQHQKILRENAAFRQKEELTQQQTYAQAQIQKWIGESEALKAAEGYESFDLETEMANPLFLNLLKSNVDMKHAYDVIHLDDIKQTVAASTAKQTEKAVVDNIRAKGVRPAENGVSSSTGVVYKSDVSKLSAKDRQEAIRQARQGKRIDFK